MDTPGGVARSRMSFYLPFNSAVDPDLAATSNYAVLLDTVE